MTEDPEKPKTRRCALCKRKVRIIGYSGPIAIKEPCRYECGSGYVKPEVK